MIRKKSEDSSDSDREGKASTPSKHSISSSQAESATTLCASPRNRSRSPQRASQNVKSMHAPELLPGTEHWAVPLLAAVSGRRAACGGQTRTIKMQVDCCGTLPEALISKVHACSKLVVVAISSVSPCMCVHS